MHASFCGKPYTTVAGERARASDGAERRQDGSLSNTIGKTIKIWTESKCGYDSTRPTPTPTPTPTPGPAPAPAPTPAPLTARFNVTSPTRGTDSCEISSSAGDIDCRFDAGGSTGQIVQYLWKIKVGARETSENRTQPDAVLDTDCALLNEGTQDSNGRIRITVELQVQSRDGSISSTFSRSINVWTRGRCIF